MSNRKLIAEHLGWTKVHEDKQTMDEETVFTMWGVPPEFSGKDFTYAREVPDYDNDANVCIATLKATGAQWKLSTSTMAMNDVFICSIDTGYGGDFRKNAFGEGATPCEAMIKALLAWYR